MSLHSGFIVIHFDEAAGMQCRYYFSYTYFRSGYLVRVTCSRSSHALFYLLRLDYCTVGITLCRFALHLPLFAFELNLIVQFTSKFRLSCTDLCKVSTDDSDHFIS